MSSEFSTLNGLGKFISGLGWFVSGISWLAFGLSLFFIVTSSGNNGFGNRLYGSFSFIPLLFSIFGGIVGILMIAFGQLISCFVSIERNTKDTLKIFTDRIKK